MNSPDTILRYRSLNDVEHPERIPDRVIVDISEEMEAFMLESMQMQSFDLGFDELFNEILMYLSDKELVEEGLQALAIEVSSIHSKENGFEDGELLTAAAVNLAKALYTKFLRHGLYTPDGFMPYENVSWLDNSTPILNKFQPRPALQGGGVRGKWATSPTSAEAVISEY